MLAQATALVHAIVFEYFKEHYTDEIVTLLLHEAEPRKTLLVNAPSGIGKTQSIAIYATAQAFRLATPPRARRGRGREREGARSILREAPRAIYVTVPTHQLLREFASKVTKAFVETASITGRFTRQPKLILLKGSVYSCVDPDIRQHFREILDYIRAETGLDYRTGLQYRILLDRYEELSESERERLEQELAEYSLYSELEMTLGYLCQTCPRNNVRNNLEFLRIFAQSRRVNIVDTEEPLETLIEALRSEGFYEVNRLEFCPYRAFLRLYIHEAELFREHRDCVPRNYIFCMTHAMYASPYITDVLESRYRIVRTSGRYVRHIHIIDEVDYILLNPPLVRLPIHVSPQLDLVTPSHVRELARKYGGESHVSAMVKLVEYSRDLYEAIIDASTIGGVEGVVACNVAEAFARYVTSRELPMYIIYRANQFLKAVRTAIGQALAMGEEVDVRDLAIFCVLCKIVEFWWTILDIDLPSMSLDQIMRRVEYPCVYEDPRARYYIELDHRQGIARVVHAGLGIRLVEHALKVALDPDYPYPVQAKIGLTATFSPNWLTMGMPLLVPQQLVENILSKLKIYEIYVPYRNLIFAKACIWLPAQEYRHAIRIIEELPLVDEEDLKKISEGIQKVRELGARKIFLLDDSETFKGHAKSLEVLLNLLHELTHLLDRYLAEKERINVIVFTGTRSQFDAFGIEASKVAKKREVYEHGVYSFKFLNFTLDKSRRDNFTLEVEVVDRRGTCRGNVRYITLVFTYARSRYSRGVDLENFDVAMIIAPPLKLPTTLAYVASRSSEDDVLDYIDASVTVQQCVFRIVRRLCYREPKLLIFDVEVLKRPYLDYITNFLSSNIILAVATPLADFVEGRIPTETY